jgi:uncharacterized membrane protein YjgN (DUF898 family)
MKSFNKNELITIITLVAMTTLPIMLIAVLLIQNPDVIDKAAKALNAQQTNTPQKQIPIPKTRNIPRRSR